MLRPIRPWGDKVAKGICAPTKLNILEPETYSLYRDLMIMKGIAPAQLKPVHIIRNELQRKFFFQSDRIRGGACKINGRTL